MIRRLPIISTLVVLGAVTIMIALGVWQLRRAHEKDALIAHYEHARELPPITWPKGPLPKSQFPLFRHATGICLKPLRERAVAGENRAGDPGYAHIVDCSTGQADWGMSVEVGWSKNPNAKVDWTGGPVSGIIAPDRHSGLRLVAASAPSGLEPSAEPSVTSIPNNHRSYAVQWFSFAVLALLIYGFALRQRRRENP